MKHVIVAAAGALALVAGTAFAGDGGCNYGKHAAEVAEVESPVLASAEVTDPKLLAKLKKIEDEKALEKIIQTPVVHN